MYSLLGKEDVGLENIFISTDWHLYSDEANAHHPYRTMLDLTLLKNNVGRDMSPADLWLFLGDLCDPKVANRETIRRILETIPARKVLVRGNHDTEDDQWYLDLGFDQVTDGVVIHNMLFTHRPEPVPKDWINVHGHIHFEKIAIDGTHINAYATNWNDTCHPVLLDDLLHGARVQKIDVSNFKEEKYRKYFERTLENDPTRTRLDLTDEFKLYPVDESAGSVQTMHEILEFNRELGDWDYGVWNGTRLIKNPKDADYANYITMKCDQFARTKGGTCWDYVPYEISEFAKRWPKVQRHAWNIYFEDGKSSPSHAFMTFQVGRGGWMLFEASDKMHRGIWCGGSEDDIVSQCFLWLAKINGVDIKKTRAWATRYAPLESRWFGIKPQTYMDQLTKTVDEWKIDPTVELIPYGESVNEGSSLIESILFPDVDTTKHFEADDNEYKKKAAKAEVDQKADSVVTLDEAKVQFRKGAGGDDQVRITGKMAVKTPNGLGYQPFDATLMAKDALYNQIKIAPQLIERERIASAQNMRDIAEYLNEQLSRVDDIKKAYPQLSAYELIPTTASMFYASMAEYEDGRIVSKSRVEKFLDLLPDLDGDEFKDYINAVLMFLDRQKEALTQAVNAMVRAAGATIAQGNLLMSDDPKAILAGYEALHIDQYCSDDDGTLTFNYEPIGRGTVIVGKECVRKHMYRRKENLAVRSFIKSLDYDYVIMAEGVKDNTGRISIEPINYGTGSSHRTYTSVEDLIEAIDPTGRHTFWVLVCNENRVVIGDNTKRIHYADNMVFHESVLPANDILGDAIDDYMDHDHMFRTWRTGIMKMLEKHMPKYISRDSEYLRLKFKKTGITAKIKTIDDSAKYLKKVEAVLDAYASMLVVSKIILTTIEKRYEGRVNETVGDSLVIDLYHDSDYANESSSWMWYGVDPLGLGNRDIVIVEETSTGELPYANALKSYASLIETMEFLGMPNTKQCPMHVGSTIAEDFYGGTDPFDTIYNSYRNESKVEPMTESSHSINVPMDLKALDEALQARAPRILYHGSNTLITGELLPMDSGTTGVHLFATDSYAFALAFSGKQWNDLELNQTSIGGTMYLTEILPGKLQEKYGDGGFVYELPGNTFSRFGDTRHEFITDVPVKPIKVHRIFNLIDEMRKAGVKIYEYPNLPLFIKSRKDYILKKCKEHHLKPSVEMKRMMNAQGESDRSKSVKLNEFANMMVDALNERQASAKDFFGKATTNGKDRLVLYPMATARPGPRTIMASNILDNYRMVNPLELDTAELIKVETPEDLLEYFKKKARVYYDDPKAEKTYNAAFPGYVTCMRVLIRMMAMTGDPDLVTIDDVAGMIPTDMSDDKFKSWIKSVIDEVEDFRGFVENILLSNLDAIGDSELRGRIITATTTKSDRLKALAKIVEKRVLRNGSPVIHGKTAVYDFRSIARAIVYRNLDTFSDERINLVNYLKRAADYDYVVISHGHMVDGEWCILPITIDGRDYTKVDELLDVLCKTDDTKVLLMCCNPGAKAPAKNRPGVDYVLTSTLLESAVPVRSGSKVENYIDFLDEELAAIAAVKAACAKTIWSYDPILSPKKIEYLTFDHSTKKPMLVKDKIRLDGLKPKKVIQAYHHIMVLSCDMYFKYVHAARSLMKLILRYRDGKMNEVGHYWTNIGTFAPAALDEGFAFMNIPTLRFDGYAECLEDAAAYVAYLNIGKDRPQDILDRQLIGYSEPTSMGEAYEIVGSKEVMDVVVLGEAADYATYDKNHKQQGHLNLSDLRLVKIDKEYLKKHGKKGALKDAAACGKYCTSVAWELDGEPVVSIAVGYPNPAEREPGDNYNWIGNLLVDPKYRGYGLGKQAMEYAIKELGGDALAVRSSNEVAISMYKKRGFKTSKDSARAVANKHANYYQMYLHEDIGTSIGELDESASYFKKMTGPGGDYIWVSKDITGLNKDTGIMASNIIDNYTMTNPDNLDIRKLEGIRHAENVIDYFGNLLVDVIRKNNGSISQMNDGMSAGLYVFARYVRKFGDRIGSAEFVEGLDGLIPVGLSQCEFDGWMAKCLEGLEKTNRSMVAFYNAQAMLVGESIESANLVYTIKDSDKIKNYAKLAKKLALVSDMLGTHVIDMRNCGKGIAYFSDSVYNDVKILHPARYGSLFDHYDVIVCSHGGDVNGVWTIDPVYINKHMCRTADSAIRAIRSENPNARIGMYCCNPGGHTLADGNNVRYLPTNAPFESAMINTVDAYDDAESYMDMLDQRLRLAIRDHNRCVDLIKHLNRNSYLNRFVYMKMAKHGPKLTDRVIDSPRELEKAQLDALDIAYNGYVGFLKFIKSFVRVAKRSHDGTMNEAGYRWMDLDASLTRNHITLPEDRFDTIEECIVDAYDYVISRDDLAFGNIVIESGSGEDRSTYSYNQLINEAIAETDSIDRQEKERIANQYELRDVGNTHMQEDRIYADIEEYKRQNALKKKQRAKEQEHDRRMRYLKKANRVRKRKRILRKIKRAILPGVKNEDVGSVDNTDTESREIADIRQEETFGGDRRRYFESKVQYANASEADNGPTIIESSVKIQFRKPVLENAGGDNSTEVIDVVFFSVDGVVQQIGILGKSDTRILTVQRTGSGDSSRISLVVGTDVDPKLYSRGKPSYDLFIVFGEDGFNILGEVKRRFDAYASKHAVFSLDGSADSMTTAEFCELLIRYLSGIEPNDTLDVQLAHHSDTMEIDKVAVSKKVDLLIAEKNLQQKLQEGTNIDLYPDNPWQDLILEYQLGFDGNYNS